MIQYFDKFRVILTPSLFYRKKNSKKCYFYLNYLKMEAMILINLFEIYNKVDTNEIHRTCVHQLVYK